VKTLNRIGTCANDSIGLNKNRQYTCKLILPLLCFFTAKRGISRGYGIFDENNLQAMKPGCFRLVASTLSLELVYGWNELSLSQDIGVLKSFTIMKITDSTE